MIKCRWMKKIIFWNVLSILEWKWFKKNFLKKNSLNAVSGCLICWNKIIKKKDFNLFSKGKKKSMSYRNWINNNMILHKRKRRSNAKDQTGKVGKKKRGFPLVVSLVSEKWKEFYWTIFNIIHVIRHTYQPLLKL